MTGKRNSFQAQPIALAMDLQAAGHEVCRLLEFGGELAPVRAHRLSRQLVRTAHQLEHALSPTTRQAA